MFTELLFFELNISKILELGDRQSPSGGFLNQKHPQATTLIKYPTKVYSKSESKTQLAKRLKKRML